ncbi:MAG TPA: putative sugar O-methyltransferase [Candidatus Saccharimonadales bacterium]|nr:putative sugar O-methyltransferase [Candidatus Saccharimonadales bacterium]
MIVMNENIAQVLRVVRNKYYRFTMRSMQGKLRKKKNYQKKDFEQVKIAFAKKYNRICEFNDEKFTTPLWKEFNAKLEKIFLPSPPFDFLQDPTIMRTMFATAGGEWLERELQFLETHAPKGKLKYLLEEDYVGDPLLMQSRYLTSHTTIHHLYHFIKFLDVTKAKPSNIKTVVEWGGGYGNMIRILRKFFPKNTTYIMIDTAVFCCLQWLYLSTLFGENNVHLLDNPKAKIQKNKINIVPLQFLENSKIKADLFISTWALSESGKASQDLVAKMNFFDAKHLLIAYQTNPIGLFDPARAGKLAQKRGAIIEKIDFLPGNYYALR